MAVYSIRDGAVLAGELPPKKHKLVDAWIEIHQDELIADWQLTDIGKKPFPIRGARPVNIAEIIPKDNYTFYIRTEDGRTGIFDVKPYLESEAFAPLKDRSEFERVRNGKYLIEWDCAADLSADTIQALWKTVAADCA